MIGFKMLGISFGKGLLWTLCAMFFGLLQLWIVVGNGYLKENYSFPIVKLFIDGTLLFFATAIVASICTDYYLGKANKLPRIVSGFVYFLYPAVVLSICIWLFSTSFTSSASDLNIEFLKGVQLTVLSMTLIYATMTKTIMYFFELGGG